MRTDEQIIEELKRAAEGLLFMSEADYPFEIVRLERTVEPNDERLRVLGGAAADAPVETRSLDEFFRAAVAEPDWKKGEELATARRFKSLVRLLKESLSETRVYRIGEINMAVFILGKSMEGNWLGLRTRVVET
jgi:hypothetical protein